MAALHVVICFHAVVSRVAGGRDIVKEASKCEEDYSAYVLYSIGDFAGCQMSGIP
jgi:hypothetical protein